MAPVVQLIEHEAYLRVGDFETIFVLSIHCDLTVLHKRRIFDFKYPGINAKSFVKGTCLHIC